jgi:O-antigen/teichoic acid export membrane protein
LWIDESARRVGSQETIRIPASAADNQARSEAAGLPEEPLALPAPTLTQRTVRGVAWFSAQMIGGKIVALAGQLALASLLDARAFGLWAQVFTVAMFATLIQQGGLHEILIQRHGRIDRWATPAFWMSMGFGLLAGLFMVGAAPVVAFLYDEPDVIGLILVAAIAQPLHGLGLVPGAFLYNRMRFKLLACVGWMLTLVQWSLCVVLATRGWGAYSFIIPLPVIALIRTGLFWAMARPSIGRSMMISRWRFLIGSNLTLLATGAVSMLVDQGDRIILSMANTAAVVGIYHFGFLLSMQIRTFGAPLYHVLLPVLSRIQDDQARQAEAFLRVARALMALVLPVSLVMAAAAGPLFRAALPAKWAESVPVFQALAVSAGFAITWSLTRSLLLAQGRFRTALMTLIASAAVFLAAVAVAAKFGGATTVAVTVAGAYAVAAIFCVKVAVTPAGTTLLQIIGVYAAPAAAALLAALAAMGVDHLIPSMPARDWVSLLVLTLVGLALYIPLIRLFAPRTCGELMERFEGLVGRLPWRRTSA